MFPRRMPLAEMKEKLRTVINGDESSAANQLFPLPSGPDGHRMFWMSLKPVSVDEGEPMTWAFCNGMGTRDEEKGEAPAEKGTFGLLVLFKTALASPKDVINEPAKNKLASEALVVMEVTSAWAPEIPVKGALDQEPALVS